MIRFTCGLLVRSLCARPRVQSAPGFPCALFFWRGWSWRKPRAQRAARTRTCIRGLF